MNQEIKLVKKFHNKFKVPVLKDPALIPRDRYHLRYELIREEVEEYYEGAKKKDLANIAKELADILYSVYGTILEHGLEKKMSKIFLEVHRSHMSKTYRKYKMHKGSKYFEPDIARLLK